MPTQTFVAETGTHWGRTFYDGEGPSYGRSAAGGPDSVPPIVKFDDEFGSITRTFFELRISELVSDGYVAGTALASGTLDFTNSSISGEPFNVRLVVDATAVLADTDEDLFTKCGPSNTAWSANVAISGVGAVSIPLNATALTAIAALGGSDKRIIGLCLVTESVNSQFFSNNVNVTLSITPAASGPGVQATPTSPYFGHTSPNPYQGEDE